MTEFQEKGKIFILMNLDRLQDLCYFGQSTKARKTQPSWLQSILVWFKSKSSYITTKTFLSY